MQDTNIRHDWKLQEVQELYALPFNDLIFKAAQIHRNNFDHNEVQTSSLLSIKTGGCAEDCKYCPQSANNESQLKAEKLMEVQKVVEAAKKAKAAGAGRFCMGAAWRSPKERDMENILKMVKEVKALGLETCLTMGMVDKSQTKKLKDAGLDYYNHNIDSSEEYYKKIITTRTYQDRLDTLQNICEAGLKTCSGGIIGMGETLDDRAKMLITLANLPEQPNSVPINRLVRADGIALNDVAEIDDFDFIRTIAIARIMMPKSYVRLSAGRQEMNDQIQAFCFFAGANSIFYGEKLLTTDNADMEHDVQLLKRLGIKMQGSNEASHEEDDDWFEDDDQPTYIGCGGGCSCH